MEMEAEWLSQFWFLWQFRQLLLFSMYWCKYSLICLVGLIVETTFWPCAMTFLTCLKKIRIAVLIFSVNEILSLFNKNTSYKLLKKKKHYYPSSCLKYLLKLFSLVELDRERMRKQFCLVEICCFLFLEVHSSHRVNSFLMCFMLWKDWWLHL